MEMEEETSTQDMIQSIKKVEMLEAASLCESVVGLVLYQCQVEVARYLEMGYLSVAEFPDVSRKLRETAVRSRNLHTMTADLMKTFVMQANHVLTKVLPMIIDGIDLQDKELIDECLDDVAKIAEEMTGLVKRCHDECVGIQENLDNHMKDLEKTHQTTKEDSENMKRRMKELEDKKDILQKNIKSSRENTKKLEDKLNDTKEEKRAYIEKELKTEKDYEVPIALGFMALFTGPVGAAALGVSYAATKIAKAFCDKKGDAEMKARVDRYKYQSDMISQTIGEIADANEKEKQAETEALENLHEIRRLTQDEKNLGDISSLVEASEKVGQADKLFGQIIDFWKNIKHAIDKIRKDEIAARRFAKKLEDPRYTERLLREINAAKKTWSFLGGICSLYVEQSEKDSRKSISTIYNFLYAPIMRSKEERCDRIRAVTFEIEEDMRIREI